MGAAMDTAKARGIILATTIEIEGHPVQEYLGIVTGEASIEASLPTTWVDDTASVKRAGSSAFEQQVREARSLAIAAMATRAEELGATAIIAIDIDYARVTTSGGKDLLV